MKAVKVTTPGPVDVLQVVDDFPVPQPREHDVVVDVKAIGVNPIDYKARDGEYGPKEIVGYDVAGIVSAVGSAVTRFKVGDEVYAAGDINRPGSYAEKTALDERVVALKPKRLSFAEAAALPLTALTAFEAYEEQFHLQDAKAPATLLVFAGAGGVGSIAIQLAKVFFPAVTVVATASRPETVEFARKQGADHVISHRGSIKEQSAAVGIAGYDYILATVGIDDQAHFDSLVDVLNPFGHISSILPPGTPLQLGALFIKRASLHFELMFSRSWTGIGIERQGDILTRIAEKVDQGLIHSTLTSTLNLWKDHKEAQEQQASGTVIGKIVLLNE